MQLELVTIGTELLLGFTVDTNSAEIAQALTAAGVRVLRRTTVSDDPAAIDEVVRAALARTGAVLTTGGLGPTRDDITKKVVADIYDAPLEFQEPLWEALLERYRRLQRAPAESNRTQAEVPRGAAVLTNRWGSAPGLWLEGTPGLVIMLPGVPHEMRKLLQHEVLPRLAGRAGTRVIRSRTVRTVNIPESTLAERLGDIEDAVAPLTVAYLPGLSGVDVRITAWHMDAGDADRRLAEAVDVVRARAGEGVYGEDGADLATLVIEAARERKRKLAVAESCTGGMLGGALTRVPGASAAFLGGIIAYDNAVKAAQLGVPAETLERFGAVSRETAAAMAEGARERFGADLAISVTGVAGPDGGSVEKPVGLVWFGLADAGETRTERRLLFGGREAIRARARDTALELLRTALAKGG